MSDTLERNEEIKRLYHSGEHTLQAIGDRYGLTRERIRQILPTGAATVVEKIRRDRKRTQKRTQKFLAACQRALAENRKCQVCKGWILRNTKVTCSHECAEAYLPLRHFDEHEEHRRETARTYLAKPEKYKKSLSEWAEKMLGPSPPPPNRRYLVPGSKRSELIRKYRPAEYEMLLKGIV